MCPTSGSCDHSFVGALKEPEVVVPFPAERGSISSATHVRGSVICASQKSLRARSLLERYAARLPEGGRDAMLAITAQSWLPVDVALEHYRACDALILPRSVIEDIGGETGRLLNESVLSVALRMTREVGLTPWTVIAQIDRMRERLWKGGAFGVFKRGPKEALVEWVGQPCAASPYYQVAFGAYMQACVRLFCKSVYVNAVPRLCTSTSLGYRLSWV